MISISPPLAVLIANPKTSPGVDPGNRTPVTGKPAASALEAPFIGECHMTVPNDVALGGTGIEAVLRLTKVAYLFIHADVNIPVHFELIQGQFVFYLHIALLARMKSERSCMTVNRPFMDSRTTWNVFFRGLPSLQKIRDIISQAHWG
jgi:hypothetical protein